MRPATSLIGASSGRPPRAIGHRLVGDAGGARCDQPFGLRRVGGEMQIGEQHLALAQHRDLVRLRLLHLDDHVGGGEHLRRGRRAIARAGRPIGSSSKPMPAPAPCLDQHLMAVMDQLAHAAGHEPDAVFVGLDLLRNADQHDSLSFRPRSSARRERAEHLVDL